jgi:hypothetical protein
MISVLLTILMAGLVLVGLAVRRRSSPVAVGIIVLALAGVWFAWRPQDLTILALWLGVGRGADLALYIGLSISFLAIAALVLQLRHLQIRFTLLAREFALLEAQLRADRRRRAP